MACEHFEEGRLVSCGAVAGVLVPSLREREDYCRTEENFRRCPTYQAAAARERRLAQSEYYELWTVPHAPRHPPDAAPSHVTVVHTSASDDVQPDVIRAG